jgi:pimeloyl-ACP methyl ester carboxylesterase
MPELLDIRYAKSGGASIAYHVAGEGDVDFVYVPEFVSNLVYGWELPHWRALYERFARSFRVIRFDKRGTGLSDGGGQFATLETRMEDLGAVLDAVGSERAVIFSGHEGCAMATLYAATYPERVIALASFSRLHAAIGAATRKPDARACVACARNAALRSGVTSSCGR